MKRGGPLKTNMQLMFVLCKCAPRRAAKKDAVRGAFEIINKIWMSPPDDNDKQVCLYRDVWWPPRAAEKRRRPWQ